jgi:hypothetical protein
MCIPFRKEIHELPEGRVMDIVRAYGQSKSKREDAAVPA